MILGCIGDDFTGSSDLANTLARGGMRTVQYCAIPSAPSNSDVEAGVVALKSRGIAHDEAVRQSLAALDWLKRQGCRQFFFKYCSTFDSTDSGNIGPVAEALADALDARSVIVCPAFPATGRTVYLGHLFVADRLLSESGMENHPLTPMHDPDIRRVLSKQTKGAVGHVGLGIVSKGSSAIAAVLASQASAGRRLIVVDAVCDEDLLAIGAAAVNLPLVTGGSGAALGLPGNFAKAGFLQGREGEWHGLQGPVAALAGSTSQATRRQIESHRKAGHPLLEIDANAVMSDEITAEIIADWALRQEGVPLAFSSSDQRIVVEAQARYGREEVSSAIEGLFAATARRLVARGVGRLVCAGGETSGAVVTELEIDALEIGPEIDAGVPALKVENRELALALKSGNFGAGDFFEKAARILGGSQ